MNQPKYQLKTHRLLSDAESLYLVKRWQQHKCKKSRDLLIECNQKFVYAVASVYRRKYSHVHLCDLVCYGNIGFIKGIERFDPNMGFSLRTFCVRWIIQSIQKEVNENESLIRLPPKYSVSLIIPKSDTATVEKIKNAIEAAYKEGESKLRGVGKSIPALQTIKTPLRDGDLERPATSISSSLSHSPLISIV
jgi:RNA polymerase sigma factor (sigma-70 family)